MQLILGRMYRIIVIFPITWSTPLSRTSNRPFRVLNYYKTRWQLFFSILTLFTYSLPRCLLRYNNDSTKNLLRVTIFSWFENDVIVMAFIFMWLLILCELFFYFYALDYVFFCHAYHIGYEVVLCTHHASFSFTLL
jgi:hypothetical protein